MSFVVAIMTLSNPLRHGELIFGLELLSLRLRRLPHEGGHAEQEAFRQAPCHGSRRQGRDGGRLLLALRTPAGRDGLRGVSCGVLREVERQELLPSSVYFTSTL